MLDTVEKQQVLEASEFFADVPAFLRESILSSARLRSFACRDLMFVVDGPRNETLLLMKGCAKIAQFTKDGKEIALRLAVPGNWSASWVRDPGVCTRRRPWRSLIARLLRGPPRPLTLCCVFPSCNATWKTFSGGASRRWKTASVASPTKGPNTAWLPNWFACRS